MASPNPEIVSNEEEPSSNGWFKLDVPSNGKIAAVKKIVRHLGKGTPVKANDILKKLKELKVVYGIDHNAIETLLKSVEEHNIPEEPFPIAKGDVEDGENGSIEWCIEGITETNSEFLVVPKTKIAVRTLSTQGIKGKNVFGKVINPRPGFDQQLSEGEGVSYHEGEDEELIYEANCIGLLRYNAGVISVDSGFNVSNDKFQVHMDIYSGKIYGTDNNVTETDVLNVLEIAGVKFGINNEQIKAAIEKSKTSESVLKNVLVAEGKLPVNGDDEFIEWCLEVKSEDINNRSILPGQKVAIKKPRTEPIPGINVYEEEIAGDNGGQIKIICGEGVEETKGTEGDVYVAHRLGVVDFESDTLTVKSGVKVSEDKMKVTMSLLRTDTDNEESNILLEHVVQTLNDCGVIYGVKTNAINMILGNINKERKSKLDLLVAEGEAPVNGSDDVVEWKLEVKSEDDSQRAVLPGQIIATINSNSKSKLGVNVFEEEILGVDGKDLTLDCGSAVEVIEENRTKTYLAQSLGLVNFDSNKLSVEPSIKISDDNLKVTMSLMPPSIESGKADVLLSHVIATLHEQGIVYGIKNDEINKVLKELNKERISIADVLVAEGLPAKDGVNARIEFDKEISVNGKVLENGEIDYNEKSYPWNVKINDVIGKLIPPKRAEDGRNVKGEDLIANQEKSEEQVLEGIKKEADGTLRVTEGGVLLIAGTNLKVSDCLELEDGVCKKTGNIKSDKTVNVKGYVEPGLILETKGDAIIQENVEDATVSAEGDVVIKSGVRGTHSKIIACGDLNASFAENAELIAKGDIVIANSVINCHIESQGVVRIGTKTSQKSALVGDVTHALKGVEATTLGSDSFSKTVIELGANTDDYMRLKELVDEILAAKKGLDDLNRLFEHSCKNPKSQNEQNALILKLTETRDLKSQEHQALLDEKEKVGEIMEESSNAKVRVYKRVYPGVIIRMLNKLHEVKEERGPGTFLVKGEKIIFEPG